ncbi:MAG: threonine/serine exporter family protein [Fuerstiella sp.]
MTSPHQTAVLCGESESFSLPAGECESDILKRADAYEMLTDVTAGYADIRLKSRPECSAEALRDIVDLSLWAGQLLLQHGAETERVERCIHQLGTALGCTWLDVLVSPDAIIVTTISGQEFRTKVRRVARFGGVNMTVIADIQMLTKKARHGELDRRDVRETLQRVDVRPKHYNRWLLAGMIGLACASFSQLFGGDVFVLCTTFVASSVAMFFRQELIRKHFNNLLSVAATSFLAGTLAAALGAFLPGQQPEIAMAAAVLMLVPGVPLINSFDDLIHGQVVSGVVRGATGMLISLSIALGLAVAVAAQGATRLWGPLTPPQSLLEDAVWSGIAATGFAMLFNVPRKALCACCLCGAAGHVVRTILMHGAHGPLATIEFATFFAALFTGFMARILARRTSLPASIYAIPAVIPMVPGTFAFGSMMALLSAVGLLDGVAPATDEIAVLITPALLNGAKTALICGALAVGLKTPALLFDRQKPIV